MFHARNISRQVAKQEKSDRDGENVAGPRRNFSTKYQEITTEKVSKRTVNGQKVA
jgi:hypothetical protein